MKIDDFKSFSTACFRDYPPPCTCACPLELDVRAVIDKVRKNNFTSAYRLYRNKVLFPAIVSRICDEPCRMRCVRKNSDESIFLKKIEAACVAFTKDAEPTRYHVPKKPYAVAIIGAGLSGLSCALKLAARNYTVTIYEKRDKPGGQLWNLMPPEIFLGEIEAQFGRVEYERFYSHEVENLDSVVADAIYIATGKDGSDFGLKHGMDRNSLGTARRGVFLGGSILGASPVEAIEHGVRVSYSIEKYLQLGAMDGVPETYTKPVSHETFYELPVKKQHSSISGKVQLGAEEAVAEGLRCMRCNCSQCHAGCELMKQFKAFPQKITTDVISTLRPIEKFSTRIASRMINSCNVCGLCGRACPEQVDMETCFLEARRRLHKDGAMPAAYHDFWLRDMNFSCSEAYFLYTPDGVEKSGYMFFPGCQLGASDPDYVVKSYEYLSDLHADTSLLLACCSAPADWAGDVALRDAVLEKIKSDWEKIGKPKLILACPTCRKTFMRYFPEAEIISLYEMLAQSDIKLSVVQSESLSVSIFDPCSSREDPSMQKSIRELAKQSGLLVEELEITLDEALCCGFGGHMYAANPSLFKNIVNNRIHAGDNEYITYCTNCRDIFAASGKACRHILDILFTGNTAYREPPSLSRRRANRMSLKTVFAEKSGIPRPIIPPGDQEKMIVRISDELIRKMDNQLILEEEVKAVVEHCESSGEKLFDPKTGWFIGHKRIGIITYWVTYTKDDAGITLTNVYSHRMSIES